MSQAANTFGNCLKMTSFGESHGAGLGVVVDGLPAGVQWQAEILEREIRRRRPGQISATGSRVVSARAESDLVEVLSGVYEGMTLGTPIAMLTRNQDARSQDYAEIVQKPRVGHADDVWQTKFGHHDPRGGGRSSGRETVSRVMAGSVAQMLTTQLHPQMRVLAFAQSVGPLKLLNEDYAALENELLETSSRDSRSVARGTLSDYVDQFVARFTSPSLQHKTEQLLLQAIEQGESYGGVAEVWIQTPPAGLGQPVFHKLKADLASAMLSIGAVNGFEFGSGFSYAANGSTSELKGTQFHQEANSPNYGGIRGGISTGERICFRVHFKPTSSILDVAKKGRHDPYIITRAIPVIEAMTHFVLADHILWQRLDKAAR